MFFFTNTWIFCSYSIISYIMIIPSIISSYFIIKPAIIASNPVARTIVLLREVSIIMAFIMTIMAFDVKLLDPYIPSIPILRGRIYSTSWNSLSFLLLSMNEKRNKISFLMLLYPSPWYHPWFFLIEIPRISSNDENLLLFIIVVMKVSQIWGIPLRVTLIDSLLGIISPTLYNWSLNMISS